MWRIVIAVLCVASFSLLLRAETGGNRVMNAALVQVQDCIELGERALTPVLPDAGRGGEGVTFKSLLVMLAIGLLSVLFCVPAALVAEYFSRRGNGSYPGTAS